MDEHTILVAFTVEADTREEAHNMLMRVLPRPHKSLHCLTSWWVAEDDRRDGSDCDSAVFVHPGAQSIAAELLHNKSLTNDCNLYPRRRPNLVWREVTPS